MSAATIGNCWKTTSWVETCWEDGTWADKFRGLGNLALYVSETVDTLESESMEYIVSDNINTLQS